MSRVKVLTWADTPSIQYMEQNSALAAANGNDGVILQPLIDPDGIQYGTQNNFSWKMWGTEVLPWDNFIPMWQGYATIPSDALRHNFIRANVTPGGVDWFDTTGMANVLLNFTTLAAKARDSYCRGIVFDNEHYTLPGTLVFSYIGQPQQGSHTYNEYKTQVYNTGLAMGAAMWAEFPTMNLMVTLGYSVFVDAAGPDQDKQYALLPSFLDGLYDSTESYPCVTITMANEIAYGCQDSSCFEGIVAKCSDPGYVGNSPQYITNGAIGMGLNLTAAPFDNTITAGNYFNPTEMTDAIVLAARYVDKYVWVYSGSYLWFRDVGIPGVYKLNSDYADSIINALPGLP